MSEDECVAALKTGWAAVDETSDLLVTGEMGIGNTTSAAAIALALYGGSGADWAGRGTGVDDAGLSRKAKVIEAVKAIEAAKAAPGAASQGSDLPSPSAVQPSPLRPQPASSSSRVL